jgi:transcriptional regulator with XRE-family HTH domain
METRSTPPASLGATLRKARLARRLTARELSRRAGVDDSYVAKIERGERLRSDPVLRSLCVELRIHLRDLVA